MGSSHVEETAEPSPPESGTHARMCPGACWGASSRPGDVSTVCCSMDGEYLIEEAWAG